MTTGVDLFVRQVVAARIPHFFYLVGGPMSEAMERCIDAGMSGIDVRDERAAVYAAVAYSRVARSPSVVLTCSGPGTVNTAVGMAHAFADRAPVVLFGGSAATYLRTKGVFQETDQVGIMRPITKWAHQVADAEAIPEITARAFQVAMDGSPGPVYIDLPSDVLYEEVSEGPPVRSGRPVPRPAPDEDLIRAAAARITSSTRPVIFAGSGILWSDAQAELVSLAELLNAPCFTTPITRGLIADDHPLALPGARSTALREADCVIAIGTRDNYILNYMGPPVVNGDAAIVEVNVDAEELSRNRVAEVSIMADARLALRALLESLEDGSRPERSAWVEQLRVKHEAAMAKISDQAASDETPIHPLRLCAEIERAIPRDAIRVVDGHETLGFARRGLRSFVPRSTLTPGAYGTMGVGVPFGVGAQAAAPGSLVVVLTGDGAFGYHVMELDTAARHSLPVVCIVANNGGWTAGRGHPGRYLGYTDYASVARPLGCFGVSITDPSDLGEGLQRAIDFALRERKPAVVNVEVAAVSSAGRTFSRYTRHGTQHYMPV